MKTLTTLASLALASLIAQTAAAHADAPTTSANPQVASTEISQGVSRSRIAGYETLAWSYYLYQGQSMEVSGYGIGTSDLDLWISNPFGGEAGNDEGFGDEFFDSVYASHTGTYTIYVKNIECSANVVTLIVR